MTRDDLDLLDVPLRGWPAPLPARAFGFAPAGLLADVPRDFVPALDREADFRAAEALPALFPARAALPRAGFAPLDLAAGLADLAVDSPLGRVVLGEERFVAIGYLGKRMIRDQTR